MTSDIAIHAENIGKLYRIHPNQGGGGRYKSLRDSLADIVTTPFRHIRSASLSPSPTWTDFWALKDVSFEIKRGEVVGIIGRNGAGKSTLLKILSRITEPTTGRIELNGRVASLLEVGTGFHPELTGRENIYLNGAILGMKRVEINAKFDEIVAFAEIERFLDTPVKHYSSGMYVRLAFAVAAHLEPEILLVDEVLAVGDAAFQKKCLGKMEDVACSGKTILFVSHNMAAVNTLCPKAILIQDGHVATSGPTSEVIGTYTNTNHGTRDTAGRIEFLPPLNQGAGFTYAALHSAEGVFSGTIAYQNSIQVELGVRVFNRSPIYYTAINLYDSTGSLIVFTADDDQVESRLASLPPGDYIYTASYPARLLKPGRYHMTFHLCEQNRGRIDRQEAGLSFTVEDLQSLRGVRGRYRPAAVAPEISWSLTQGKTGNAP
jgi:lipopolysaccharide transport system ATP-binding protein